MTSISFIRESNRIEGIRRDPTQAEINKHDRFLTLDHIDEYELSRFVGVYQPGARLRNREWDIVAETYDTPVRGAISVCGYIV